MIYDIFKSIPHQRVVSQRNNHEEIFDLYQCGLFDDHGVEENVELVALQPQAHYRSHFHKKSAAVIYIISGTGHFQRASDYIQYQSGVRITIPAGVMHGFITITQTLFLSIQKPPIIHSETGHIDLHYENNDDNASKSF